MKPLGQKEVTHPSLTANRISRKLLFRGSLVLFLPVISLVMCSLLVRADEKERSSNERAQSTEMKHLNTAAARIRLRLAELQRSDDEVPEALIRELREIEERKLDLRHAHEHEGHHDHEADHEHHGEHDHAHAGHDLERRLGHLHEAIAHLESAGFEDAARSLAEQAERMERELQEQGHHGHEHDRADHLEAAVHELHKELAEMRREMAEMRRALHELSQRERD